MIESIQEGLGWLFENLMSLLFIMFQSVFQYLYDIFEIFYSSIREFISDSYFEKIGADFFGLFNDQVEISFNVIYWIVGVMLFFYISKNFILPMISNFISSIMDWIADLLTPL